MSLVELDLPVEETSLPGDVRLFLSEARRRIRRFQRSRRIPGFIPGDFRRAYAVLKILATVYLPAGSLFCEWGSGFGVVACLAAMLDFDAHGIEIEGELVDAAQELADDFELPVQFVCGSFLPAGANAFLEAADGFVWLTPDEGRPLAELGLALEDFGVIFAYPWPDEERLTEDLFACYGAPGALLVTYHGGDEFRLRQKPGA